MGAAAAAAVLATVLLADMSLPRYGVCVWRLGALAVGIGVCVRGLGGCGAGEEPRRPPYLHATRRRSVPELGLALSEERSSQRFSSWGR
jgi:hypothetical protein